jgi:hypothetical protein
MLLEGFFWRLEAEALTRRSVHSGGYGQEVGTGQIVKIGF